MGNIYKKNNINKNEIMQYIIEHRRLWNWIADAILSRGACVSKHDYFLIHGHSEGGVPIFGCYACQCGEKIHEGISDGWGGYRCDYCPFIFESGSSDSSFRACMKESIDNPYINFMTLSCAVKDEIQDPGIIYILSKYARQIATLPLHPWVEDFLSEEGIIAYMLKK